MFARVPIKKIEGSGELWNGRTTIQIPADAVPTFEAVHNKLRWRLVVHGVIARWPDIDDAYDMVVLPPRTGGAS